MAKFRVMDSSHVENKRLYEKGDVVETTRDLVAMFGPKFKRVSDAAIPTIAPPLNDQGTPPRIETPAGPDDVETEEEGIVTSPLGDDVTSQFLIEGDKHLVFRKGAKYFVAYATDPNTALNEKGIKKAEVEDFIREYEE